MGNLLKESRRKFNRVTVNIFFRIALQTVTTMIGWLGRLLCCRHKKKVVLFLLAVAGVEFLFLHSQLSATQRIAREAVYPVEASSRFERAGNLTWRSVASNDQVNTNRNVYDKKQANLSSVKSYSENVAEFSVSTQEPTTTRRKIPWCTEMPQEMSRFREVVKGMLVYSVWFDDRKTQHFIRVLMLSAVDPLPWLTCHFESTSTQNALTSEASIYQHNENYYGRFGSFIASCPVPQELDSVPCFVNISTPSTEASNLLVFPVGFIDRENSNDKTGQYGICIPPVYGQISVDKVIEFVELQKILGASYFTFYDLEMPEDVRKVLNYYEGKGLVRVLPWNLPSYLGEQGIQYFYIGEQDIHYFGQPLSIIDCMYRSMSHLFFVAFNDLDEFIVPLQHNNISAMLKYIHKDEHCGHCFESVTFDISNVMQNNSQLLTQSIFNRTSQASRLWPKCIVDPRRIFEQGIHHISKPVEEYYHANKVTWDIGRVFHYRKCHDPNTQMQPKCSGFEVDKTLQKFGEQLLHNFETTQKAVAESSGKLTLNEN